MPAPRTLEEEWSQVAAESPTEEFLQRWNRVWPTLYGGLLRRMDSQDAQDALQDCFVVMWKSVGRLRFDDDAPFSKYARAVLGSVQRDRLRKARPASFSLDSPGLLEALQNREFVERIHNLLELSMLSENADELWLGKKPPAFDECLLLATLILVDGVPSDVALMVASRLGNLNHLRGEQELLQFINHPRVLKQVTFLEFLTQLNGQDASPSMRRKKEGEDSSSKRRVGRSTTFESIANCEVSCEVPEVEKATHRVTAAAEHIWNRSANFTCRQAALGGDGLWKRLAFQLIPPGMPHEEFVRTFSSAAELCGFHISSITLRAWVSNRRIYSELLKLTSDTAESR